MEDVVIWAVENWSHLLIAGLASGVAWLMSKMGKGAAKDILQRALGEVVDAVGEVQQVYVSAIKKAREDGQLTEEEKRQAKEMAMAVAKSNIGSKGLKRLAKALMGANVDSWLANKVEAAVAAKK